MSDAKIIFNEDIKFLTLNNGLQIILDYFKNKETSAVGFFLKNGSRDENNLQAGFSHFIEHMLFKGTKKITQKELSQLFDNMGGYINAYTTHELVVVYNRIPAYYLSDTINLIHEMFQNSIFSENEIEIERDVILNEIKVGEEDPHDKVYELFMENIFPDNSLGLPIIGNSSSIKNATRNDLFNFYNERFSLGNLLVAISGKIDDKILNTLEGLSFRKYSKEINSKKADQGNIRTIVNVHPSEQTHIIIGRSGFELDEKLYFKAGLLNKILGESMSSRLFQRIREELGLCYNVYSFFNKYRYENLFGIYVSVMPKNANKTIFEISKIIKDLLENGITENELEQAKSQNKVEIILNSDQINKRIQKLSYMKLTYDKIFSINEIISIIDSTTISELKEIIKIIFDKEKFLAQVLNNKKIKIEEFDF